jgi:hypothetical protein
MPFHPQDYLPDITKYFVNLTFKVSGRNKEKRNGNKTETKIKRNWKDRKKSVKKAKKEQINT